MIKGIVSLDFGVDAIDAQTSVVYTKVGATQRDAMTALMIMKKVGGDEVITLSDITLDEGLISESLGNDESDPVKLRNLSEQKRAQFLTQFIRSIVDEVMLNNSGSTRLVVPFISGIPDPLFRSVREGVNNVDEGNVNMAARHLVFRSYGDN